MSVALRAWVGLCGCLMAACAATAPSPAQLAARGKLQEAVTHYVAGPEDEAERTRLAEVVLLQGARSSDPQSREAAFAAMAGLGESRDYLYRALLDPQRPAPEQTRIRALSRLAQHGDDAAVEALRKVVARLSAGERAYALVALHPDLDGEVLTTLLTASDAATRAAAARRFDSAASESIPLASLKERLRLDPAPEVRRVALQTLLTHRALESDALAELLSSDDLGLAMAALVGLRTAYQEDFLRSAQRWLLSDVSRIGIEASRLTLLDDARHEVARGHLMRALSSADRSFRAQAVVALRSLPAPHRRGLLPADPAKEADEGVRLQLALIDPDSDRARSALLTLMGSGNERVALEAASTLAAGGEASAHERLAAALVSGRVSSRLRATRAVGHELQRAEAIVPRLADASVPVRCAAAGVLLQPTRPPAVWP